jgi:hypothetical protein
VRLKKRPDRDGTVALPLRFRPDRRAKANDENEAEQ